MLRSRSCQALLTWCWLDVSITSASPLVPSSTTDNRRLSERLSDCSDGDLRLANAVNGRNMGETWRSGRLEVCYNREWGTICDDDFESNDADVACRQLGLGSPISWDDDSGSSPAATGEIWMDDLACAGYEDTLGDCAFRGYGIHDCGHHEDVSITCSCDLGDACTGGGGIASSEESSSEESWAEDYYFSVRGDCELSRDGDCVRSRAVGGSDYGNNEECTITVNTGTHLSVVSYETEASHDYLTIDPISGGSEMRYDDDTGPDGVYVSSGDIIRWRSDGSITYCGWEICGTSAYPQSECPDHGNVISLAIMQWIRNHWYYVGLGIGFATLMTTLQCMQRRKRARLMTARRAAQQVQPSASIASVAPPPVISAVPQVVPTSGPLGQSGGGSVVEQLGALGELRARGVLDANQFEAAKAQVLGGGGMPAHPGMMGMGCGAVPMVGAQPIMGGAQMAVPVGPVVQAYAMPMQQHL